MIFFRTALRLPSLSQLRFSMAIRALGLSLAKRSCLAVGLAGVASAVHATTTLAPIAHEPVATAPARQSDSESPAYDRQIIGQRIDVFGPQESAVEVADGERVSISVSSLWAYSRSGHGLVLGNDAVADLFRTQISVRNDGYHGIALSGANGRLNAINTVIDTYGADSYGIHLEASKAKAQLRSTYVNTRGARAHALNATGDAEIDIEGGRFETEGDNAYGLAHDAARITTSGLWIRTHGRDAHGVYLQNRSATGPRPILRMNEGGFTIEGEGAAGVYANGGDVELTSVNLATYGERGHGVVAAGDARLQLNNTFVAAQGAGAWAAVVKDDASLEIDRGSLSGTAGVIWVAGTSQSELKARGAGLYADGGVLLALENTVAQAFDFTLTERSYATGDIVRSGAIGHGVSPGALNLNLRDRSIWTGGTNAVEAVALSGRSYWSLTRDSTIGTLSMSDSSLSLSYDGVNFNTLRIKGDFAGDGDIWFRTDLGAGVGDRLIVGGRFDGQFGMYVRDAGNEPASGQPLALIDALGGGNARVGLRNRGGVVDVGTYRYRLAQRTGADGTSQHWELDAGGPTKPINPVPPPKPVDPVQPPKPVDPVDPVDPPGPGNSQLPGDSSGIPDAGRPDLVQDAGAGGLDTQRPELSTGANAVVNTASVMQTIWYAEMNALSKRLGDLRLGDDRGGPWVRTLNQRQHIDNRVGRQFKQTVTGVEIGADHRILSSHGRWYLGALLGAGDTTRVFDLDGKGTTESRRVGGYATYIDDDGWYGDAVLRANRFSHDFKLVGTDGGAIKSAYVNHGVGVTLEVGKKIALEQEWFVEPQVEAGLFRASGSRFFLSNGMRVDARASQSAQVRVGGLVGRQFTFKNGDVLQPFVKLGWVQEFDGKSVVHTNGLETQTDMSGGRAQIGLGMAAVVSESHRFHISYDYSRSRKIDEPWSLNIGYRYTW